MERNPYESGMFPLPAPGNDHFGFLDFTDASVFDQYVGFIRGGENAADPTASFAGHVQQYDYFADQQLYLTASATDLFDFNVATNHAVNGMGYSSLNNYTAPHYVVDKPAPDIEEILDGEDFSASSSAAPGETEDTAAAAADTKKKGKKTDRTKTLISEQKRRGRMKEKLYALRSLVPNITKMDKASIVGDAALYVQDLQLQARKLKTEISELESSMAANDHEYHMQGKTLYPDDYNNINFYPSIKIILKMDVVQVEEKGFYVRVISNKGKHVAPLLYKAVESLTSFNVQSSNLDTSSDNLVLTFTLHIMEREMEIINLADMKMWIASSFLNQGFDFQTSPYS